MIIMVVRVMMVMIMKYICMAPSPSKNDAQRRLQIRKTIDKHKQKYATKMSIKHTQSKSTSELQKIRTCMLTRFH